MIHFLTFKCIAFRTPILSYSSTSNALSNTNPDDHFFRLVPSDKNQLDAWMNIIRKFEWKSCSVITMSEPHAEDLGHRLSEEGVDIDIITSVSPDDMEMLDSTLKKIRDEAVSKIIFFLSQGDTGRKILERAIDFEILGKDTGFVWVISSSVSSKVILFPDNSSSSKKLKSHLVGNIGTRYTEGNQCIGKDECDDCPCAKWEEFNETFSDKHDSVNDVNIPYIYDSIHTITHVIKKCMETNSNVYKCDTREMLKQISKDVELNGVTGKISFNDDGDRKIVGYDIINFYDDEQEPIKIAGTWHSDTTIDDWSLDITWPDGTKDIPLDTR